jgi:hypothetical protein
LQIL